MIICAPSHGTDRINSFQKISDRIRTASSEASDPNLVYSRADDYTVEDKSIVPDALQSYCEDKPVDWLERVQSGDSTIYSGKSFFPQSWVMQTKIHIKVCEALFSFLELSKQEKPCERRLSAPVQIYAWRTRHLASLLKSIAIWMSKFLCCRPRGTCNDHVTKTSPFGPVYFSKHVSFKGWGMTSLF